MEDAINRRGVLTGLAATGAAAGLAALARDASAAETSVRGAWLIKPTGPAGPAGFQALAAFAAGGVFVTTGSDEAGTGLGEWNSPGADRFGFTYMNFHFNRSGKLANTVKVRAAGQFGASRLSGRATLSTFGPKGKRLHPDRGFRFTGTRVRVEAP